MSELELEANYRSIDRVKYNIELLEQCIAEATNVTAKDELESNQLLIRLYNELISRETILEIHLGHINITETINAFEPKIYTL